VIVWEDYYTSNAVTGVLLMAAVATAWRLRHDRAWIAFRRRLLRRRLAVAATGVFTLAMLIAVLDSIAWRDAATEEDLAARGISAHKPRSVIDRLFPKDFEEESYSAPLARTSFYHARPLRHPGQHLLGTTIIGKDTLHQTLKGFRPAMMIGVLTTLLVVPIALTMGVLAGYFGRLVDDLVQYLYSTLASIPSILLLISLMLVMGRGPVQVCIALGVTTWVGLCRLIRAETLKLRELEYVEAVRAQGFGHLRIIFRHLVPNLAHIILISSVLRFSGLVLNESILSYFGVGLESSFGSMIVLARDELARDPVIWWNLASASTALFVIVLSANIIGDTVRDLLDPRVRGA
jgi:peptide/nickel transport system permease protein